MLVRVPSRLTLLAGRHGAVSGNPIREVRRIECTPRRPPRALTAEQQLD